MTKAETSPKEEVLPIEFTFESHAVRTLVKDGEIWFVAADVCDVLEHSNSRMAIARLDDDEKSVSNAYTSSGAAGAHEVNIINESGLYSLILTSRKPKAKAFKRWITHEVLPSIRKTGRYEARRQEASAVERRSADGIWITFRDWGRYVVTVLPDGEHHSFRTEYESFIPEDDRVNAELLCHQLKIIEAFWYKFQLLESVQTDHIEGFEVTSLGRAVQQGGDLSRHFLRIYATRGAC